MKKAAVWLAVGLTVSMCAPLAWAADLAAGAAKAEACKACHGAAGISQMKEVPSLAGQPDRFLQWQLVYFRSGTRKNALMQPMAASLTDDDIRNVAAYFAAQTPPDAQSNGAAESSEFTVGQHLAQQHRCASCHTESFGGAQAAARTADQREDYLIKALRDFKSGARTGGGVAAMADAVYPLDDDQLRALAHFMSHIP